MHPVGDTTVMCSTIDGAGNSKKRLFSVIVKPFVGVPDWIKTNAGWWADGLISEDDFLNGMKYLVEKGIIKV